MSSVEAIEFFCVQAVHYCIVTSEVYSAFVDAKHFREAILWAYPFQEVFRTGLIIVQRSCWNIFRCTSSVEMYTSFIVRAHFKLRKLNHFWLRFSMGQTKVTADSNSTQHWKLPSSLYCRQILLAYICLAYTCLHIAYLLIVCVGAAPC